MLIIHRFYYWCISPLAANNRRLQFFWYKASAFHLHIYVRCINSHYYDDDKNVRDWIFEWEIIPFSVNELFVHYMCLNYFINANGKQRKEKLRENIFFEFKYENSWALSFFLSGFYEWRDILKRHEWMGKWKYVTTFWCFLIEISPFLFVLKLFPNTKWNFL